MFGIKLICLRCESNVVTFWTCMDATFLCMNFLHTDAADRSKISSNQKRLFFAASLKYISFFAKTPFKVWFYQSYIPLSMFLDIHIFCPLFIFLGSGSLVIVCSTKLVSPVSVLVNCQGITKLILKSFFLS